MEKDKIINQINQKLDLINKELIDGVDLNDQNNMVIEEVISSNLPILNSSTNVTQKNQLYELHKASKEIYDTVSTIKEEEEIKEFFNTGKMFDGKKLHKMFIDSGLKSKFPKFNINKYLEILNNPILKITNFRGEEIFFDSYWVKKNIIAINQMIFNEMDLYILNIGKEGSGKSCWSSQQILYLYTLFSEVGLIDYAYDLQKMFFIDILSFLEEHGSQKKNDYFRIECLDEGNELNRSNFREETNQQFKYEMRTERKMLRVILINMQQIGELDTAVSLSRVNFIYNCKMRSDKKKGLLKKGYIDMYIIPRGDEIYSEKSKKILTRTQILNTFSIKLDKKKDYYVGLPTELIVKEFKFENIWGFDKEEYDSHVKDEMILRKFSKDIKLSDLQAYCLLKKFGSFQEYLNLDTNNDQKDKEFYNNISKAMNKINKYFESKPERWNSFETRFS